MEDFRRWLQRYKEEESQLRGKEPDKVVRAHFYGCDHIQALLDQDGCKGIRIYYGIDDNGDRQLILFGADANMKNIKSEHIGKGNGGGGGIDHGEPCPPFCDDDD